MTKLFRQKFNMDNEENFSIDVIVEDGTVTDIFAGEDIKYKNYSFKKGDIINNDGDNSMIHSQDILISEL